MYALDTFFCTKILVYHNNSGTHTAVNIAYNWAIQMGYLGECSALFVCFKIALA